MRQACPALAGYGLSGVWRLVRRHRSHWRRARSHMRRPDPDYDAKLAAIATARDTAAASAGRIVLLYQDEVTLGRQPTLPAAYAPVGQDAPRAERSHQTNTLTRLAATLDPEDGRVVARRASHLDVPTLVGCSQQVVAAYPAAERIYLVQDHWPVHVHPDVLVALAPQETPFPLRRPPTWPTGPSPAAVARWGALRLPLLLLPLPTYASWCSPIENLWRWLTQDTTHLHRHADDLPGLRRLIDQFLARFAHGSTELLRYVGLMPH